MSIHYSLYMESSQRPYSSIFFANHYLKPKTLWLLKEPPSRYSKFQQIKAGVVKKESKNAAAPIPNIQLKGQWLDKAGFSVGVDYCVEVYEGTILLTVEKPGNVRP